MAHLVTVANIFSGDNSYLIIGGDFNLDFAVNSNRLLDRHLILDFENKTLLKQVINQPTRISKKSSTIIDLIFVKDQRNFAESGVIQYNISDHDIVFVSYKHLPLKSKTTSFTFRSLKNFNIAKLCYTLNSLDWSCYFEIVDPARCWNTLKTIYTETLDLLAPFTMKTKVPVKSDWIDNISLDKIKTRDRLRAKLPYSTNKADWEAFARARNAAKQSINNACANFVQNNLKNNLKSPKNFWAELKNLMPGIKSNKNDKPKIAL